MTDKADQLRRPPKPSPFFSGIAALVMSIPLQT
jgi:hypothetical protein